MGFYPQQCKLDFSDIRKKDLNEDDPKRNIEKVSIEGNLSPKQINIIKAAHGKHHKKGGSANASSMQTRSHCKNKLRYFDMKYKIGEHSKSIHQIGNFTEKTSFSLYRGDGAISRQSQYRGILEKIRDATCSS